MRFHKVLHNFYIRCRCTQHLVLKNILYKRYNHCIVNIKKSNYVTR